MKRILLTLALAASAVAQAPPRSTSSAREEGKSSSKDTQLDISAPGDDSAKHPDSEDASASTGEFRPFNPHKAAKNIEVGDYYFTQKNYRAAISRYREALEWKPKDAIATFRLAQALDKIGEAKEAAENYQAYLKILPQGPFAKDSRKALERLGSSASK